MVPLRVGNGGDYTNLEESMQEGKPSTPPSFPKVCTTVHTPHPHTETCGPEGLFGESAPVMSCYQWTRCDTPYCNPAPAVLYYKTSEAPGDTPRPPNNTRTGATHAMPFDSPPSTRANPTPKALRGARPPTAPFWTGRPRSRQSTNRGANSRPISIGRASMNRGGFSSGGCWRCQSAR